MTELLIREAGEADVAAIVALLAADTLGGHGDTSAPDALPDYINAFRAIAASPNDTLYVAELGGAIVGTFQTTMITSLLGRGSKSLKIEAVHTKAELRGRGIGAAMMRFAVERARDAGAGSVQLTSNRARADAHRFYERLGFAQSHAGFKMKLR
jgi:GNAT superfamily N-acetyltransferase